MKVYSYMYLFYILFFTSIVASDINQNKKSELSDEFVAQILSFILKQNEINNKQNDINNEQKAFEDIYALAVGNLAITVDGLKKYIEDRKHHLKNDIGNFELLNYKISLLETDVKRIKDSYLYMENELKYLKKTVKENERKTNKHEKKIKLLENQQPAIAKQTGFINNNLNK